MVGDPVMGPRYINVKELVECDSVEGALALIGIRLVFS